MASPPASTKTSLGQKLRARARARWPQLAGVGVRFRGKFAYVTGQLPGGQELPLCRLRYAGYASLWGFAIYRASHDDYQDSILPSGQFAGTPEEALDCACGLYLADPSAWLPPGTDTPTNLRARPLGNPVTSRARRVLWPCQPGHSASCVRKGRRLPACGVPRTSMGADLLVRLRLAASADMAVEIFRL